MRGMDDSKTDQTEETPSGAIALAGTLGLATIPPLWILLFQTEAATYLGLGALSWTAAVILKHVLMKIPPVRTMSRAGPLGAFAWGSISAASELGATLLLVIAYGQPRDPWQIIALGVGVSTVEIVYVFGSAIREHLRGPDPEQLEAWMRGARRSGWVRHMLFIERLSATLGHVGSRGLVCVWLATSQAWLAVAGFTIFALVDGVAIFGRGRKWDWCDPPVARGFFAFVLSLGGVELAVFAWVSL